MKDGMAVKTGRLIAFRNDRLGARLISLVNALRVGNDHGIEVQVYWPEAIDIGAVFNDPTELFDAGFVARHFIDRRDWRELRGESTRIGDLAPKGLGALKAHLATGADVTVDQAFGILVLRGEAPGAVYAAFAATLDRIPFAPALAPHLGRISTRLNGATAYHIRRGDLTDALKAMNKAWPHKFVPDEFYLEHMAREQASGAPIIVFSDDDAVVAQYRKAFPGAMTMADLVDLGSFHPGARDLLELYAMSRCAKIIAPERSAFSSTAADLGGAVKCDVTADLPAEAASAAMDRLVERLANDPGSFRGDGEIGQSLVHAGTHLIDQGRMAEAARLYADHVAAGLNISFVYPKLMAWQHALDDVAGVLTTARAMRQGYVLHTKDYAEAEILCGLAHLRQGDRAQGARHIANGFWHDSGAAAARMVVALLVDRGWLGPQNFLPVQAEVMALRRRRGPVADLKARFGPLLALIGDPEPTDLPVLEPILWDWEQLLRHQSGAAAAAGGQGAAFRTQVARLAARAPLNPGIASFDALMDAHSGDLDRARARLQELVAAAPGDAMIAQRLAHVHLMRREFGLARVQAASAMAAAPGVPGYVAFAGLCALRARDWDGARALLAAAEASGLGLPSIPALLSEACGRLSARAEALAAITRAVDASPLEPRFRVAQAQLQVDLGQEAAAIGTLRGLLDYEKAPQKVFPVLAGLLVRAGQIEEARGVVAQGLVRAHDNPALLALQAELGG